MSIYPSLILITILAHECTISLKKSSHIRASYLPRPGICPKEMVRTQAAYFQSLQVTTTACYFSPETNLVEALTKKYRLGITVLSLPPRLLYELGNKHSLSACGYFPHKTIIQNNIPITNSENT